jgi:hypothetical protein
MSEANKIVAAILTLSTSIRIRGNSKPSPSPGMVAGDDYRGMTVDSYRKIIEELDNPDSNA